jgi:hypothetical protein
VNQHFVSPGHPLDVFGRSKIYIIDHNSSWKKNQRQKRESLAMEHLCVLQLETALATLVTTWLTLADRRPSMKARRIKDKKERAFGSASYEHYIRRA